MKLNRKTKKAITEAAERYLAKQKVLHKRPHSVDIGAVIDSMKRDKAHIKALMQKKAGILDPVQQNLCNEVWDERMVLRPELRKDILSIVDKVTKKCNLEGVWILGSITGHKYTDTSDIDVNVSVYEFDNSLRELANNVSGPTTNSGRHPVNLHIKQSSGTRPNWQDSYFGVYDVINNDWESLPPKREIYRDPEVEFKLEVLLARKIAEDFNNKVDKFKEQLADIGKLKRMHYTIPATLQYAMKTKRAHLKKQLTELVELAHSFEDERKFEYQWGWGVPRKSFRNILYKVLEHGRYGKLFLLLEKVPLENEFGSEDMIRKEASSADAMLSKAIELYRKGGSSIVPTFSEYYQLKQQERAKAISKPVSSTTLAVSGGVGAVAGLRLTKKKAPFFRMLRNVGASAAIASATAYGIDSIRKARTAKKMVYPQADYMKYNKIITK